MKVLFISNDPTIFDATSAARTRMRAYATAIGELHILSSANREAKEEQDGNLFLHPIHTWKLFKMRTLAKRAHTLILEKGIEVVSAQDPFEHGLAALRAICSTNAKLHIQVHTDFLSPWFVKGSIRMSLLNRYRCRLADRILPKAAGIRVVSERIKHSFKARYGSRISEPIVIPVAVNTVIPVPVPLPAHPFTFALMAVGRLEPEKRIEDIFAALKLVSKQYPMVGLFIVGEGRERVQLEHLAHSLGLADRVIFLGNRPDAWGLMQSVQAFIQASAYEGYGRTLIEAALAKVPIITTDVGIVGEVFKNNVDVLSSPVANPMLLALNITKYIEDITMRHEFSAHAEATARAHLATFGDLPTRIAADLTQTLQHA
ncbi:MAG: glycosyltransferase [Candidatus Kaiserbacteria bacterium]|nr:glycosyltransferase [Candidatus Kaiserbacteria bacterium]